MVKNKMQKIIDTRKLSVKHSPNTDFCDGKDILKILSQNYNETITFLKSASYDEIGCACWVLEDLIKIFPTQELLDCFRSRVEDFKEHDLPKNWSIPSICPCVFCEEVEIAQETLKEIFSNK